MGKKKNKKFIKYYKKWVKAHKEGVVVAVTLDKYKMAERFFADNFKSLNIKDLDRSKYQEILNKYAETHEHVTTRDFHRLIKACVLDLFYEGLVEKDPTYRVTIKGRPSVRKKRKKFLQVEELRKLIKCLNLGDEINMDWFIFISAKTGTRFAELLGVTPEDFNFKENSMSINKTWGYKKTQTSGSEYLNKFMPTKNIGSVRKIQLDEDTAQRLKPLLVGLPENEPIFVRKKDGKYCNVFSSVYNNFLFNKCRKAGVEEVTLHALRHTHASILLAANVSIHSISKRLGHSNVTTTQEVYTHVLDELKAKDGKAISNVLKAIEGGDFSSDRQ